MMTLCFGRCDATKIQKNVPRIEFNGVEASKTIQKTHQKKICVLRLDAIYGETMLWNMWCNTCLLCDASTNSFVNEFIIALPILMGATCQCSHLK